MSSSAYKKIIIVSAYILFAFGCLQKENNKLTEVTFKQPNIVWLVCEDQSPDFFPMYGDRTANLPNLEKLAQEGLVFNNAYAPVPVCAPTRSAIITGNYPTTLGSHNMRTYNAYQPQNQPGINVPSYSPVVPEGIRPFTEYLRMNGYYCTNNAKRDYNFHVSDGAWDESSNKANWRNKAENQPFFSVFNFMITHESAIWRMGKDSLFVDPATVPVPPYFPDDSVIRHDLAVNYSNLIRMDSMVGQIIKMLKEDSLYDNTIIMFYGDHGGPFPRHKRVIYETGTKVPMIAKFPEEYDLKGDYDQMVSFIDLAPTMLSLTGIQPSATMQGRALFGKYADNSPRKYLFTTSDRFDEVYDRTRAVRSQNFKYIKNFNPENPYALPVAYRMNMPLMQRLMTLKKEGVLGEKDGKWMADTRTEEELYDLVNDPYEFNNLASDPHYADTLAHLRTVLSHWIEETGDLGAIEEQVLLNRWTHQGKAEKLAMPTFENNGGNIKIQTNKSDATIIWKFPEDQSWNIYKDGIADTGKKEIMTKVSRIGFADSDTLFIKP